MNWKDEVTTEAIKTYIDALLKNTNLDEFEKLTKFEEMCEQNEIEELFIRMGFYYFGLQSKSDSDAFAKIFCN
jgi:hypothetical protein